MRLASFSSLFVLFPLGSRFGRLPRCVGFGGSAGALICRGRVIGRRMLYEFYIKMLATNVELAHE